MASAEKQLEQKNESDARGKAKKSAMKLQAYEIGYAGVIGLGEGYAKQAGFSIVTDGFGPVSFSAIQLIAGGYLAFKRTGKTREFGSAMATIGAYKLANEFGAGFDMGGIFGGGGE